MASYRAIVATSLAIRGLLVNGCPPELRGAEFRIFQAKDFSSSTPMARGVSVYLHRVTFNTSRRSLPPRVGLDGIRYRPPTPVDLGYMITAWADNPERQQELLGWAIRTLQDCPILPAGLLNNFAGGRETDPPVFADDETVELVGEILSMQDLINIWEVVKSNQQPSIPYVARAVHLDSEVRLTEAPGVQTRGFDMASLASRGSLPPTVP